MCVDIDDPAEALPGPRVVRGRVVDHVVRPKRPDEVHLLGAADAGDLGTHRLGDLDGERPNIAGRADDHHAVTSLEWSPTAAAQALEGEERRVRERRGIVERHPARHRREGLLGGADKLGERSLPEHEEVREDLVTGLEPGDVGPDRVDHAGDIEPQTLGPWCPEPEEQA